MTTDITDLQKELSEFTQKLLTNKVNLAGRPLDYSDCVTLFLLTKIADIDKRLKELIK